MSTNVIRRLSFQGLRVYYEIAQTNTHTKENVNYGSLELIGQEDIFLYRQIEHFTNNDGLSNNNVFCILQDKQGFIWSCLIATSDQ